jgi:hypothetical protein
MSGATWSSKPEIPGISKTVDIAVHVLDGRNGKAMSNQRVLVFTGESIDAVKSHAEHTDLTTDKNGVGTLRIHPDQTRWIHGRVLCYSDPTRSIFDVDTVVLNGIATPNSCGGVTEHPKAGRFTVLPAQRIF